ncbi:hypothetical protein [[Micrococcus luteus] ATCC 49442]|uniref:hypothetical protein n=1 Tax=[Micrococcus luteus] ATCC 49442 TaxID=2698727 RepID=UPI0013DAEDF7|nr:hypothetical protein [[Micrococcus luteus] ATCC 49442]
MKYSAMISAASLGAVLLAGCASPAPVASEQSTTQSTSPQTASTSPAGTSSATPTPSAPSGPDGTASRPYDFGVLVRSATNSRWNVTIAETTTTGTEQVLADNPYNEVKEGWQYVVGRMTSALNENLRSSDAGKPLSPTSVMPIFIGSDGKIYDIWNDDNSAVVLKEDWIGQPEIMAQVGVKSTGRFAIQVPSTAVPGGHFATRNEVNNEIAYFGAPVQ